MRCKRGVAACGTRRVPGFLADARGRPVTEGGAAMTSAREPGNLSGPAAAGEPAEARFIRAFFEGLAPRDLDELSRVYSEDARFQDPFNEVEGVDAIRRIFLDMFEQAPDARFRVHEVVGEPPLLYVRWGFIFTPGRAREPWAVEGVSRLVLGRDGRIVEHIDYWDPAAGIYEHLPLLGTVLRWLRRRLSVR